MRPTPISQLATWAHGRLLCGSPTALIEAVQTDSRQPLTNALFVPLKGPSFDGHHFLSTAQQQGAIAALTSDPTLGPSAPGLALIHVADTLASLQSIASRYRVHLQETTPAFVAVAITGSNGKTSTKDFLNAVLSTKYHVNATKGNLNNHIGLPLTVLSTEADHDCGVFEMGMNHPGEISPLAAIGQPDVAVITNVGTAHIEYMGSRLSIATEKGCLAWAVPPGGTVILHSQDEYTPYIAARCRGNVITAGIEHGDIQAQNIVGSRFDLVAHGQRHSVHLAVPGRHMIQNATLAAAAGLSQGLSLAQVAEALSQATLHGGRLQKREVLGLSFLDDTYNANPDSMKAALATLKSEPLPQPEGRRIAILGRMGELGTHSEAGHRSVGLAAQSTADFLLTVGHDDSAYIHESYGDPSRSLHLPTHTDATAWLTAHATPMDLILVKGSRSAAMERVINNLAQASSSTADSLPPSP